MAERFEPHCGTCYCGKRAPVQASTKGRGERFDKGPGTIAWSEFMEAMGEYARQGHSQSAETLAGRGGFSYSELVVFYLKREPTTWRPAGARDEWNKAAAEEAHRDLKPPNRLPEGWKPLKNAFTNGRHIAVEGIPDNDHNCDAMGCGSASPHVIAHVPVPDAQRAAIEREVNRG